MAATTIVEYKARPCIKCGGAGFLSCFQYIKGGECFRCGASGEDPVMTAVEREMNYAELCVALAERGFPVVRVETGDYMLDLFASEQEIQGARIMLAAL